MWSERERQRERERQTDRQRDGISPVEVQPGVSVGVFKEKSFQCQTQLCKKVFKMGMSTTFLINW